MAGACMRSKRAASSAFSPRRRGRNSCSKLPLSVVSAMVDTLAERSRGRQDCKRRRFAQEPAKSDRYRQDAVRRLRGGLSPMADSAMSQNFGWGALGCTNSPFQLGRNFDEALLGNRPVMTAGLCGKPASLAYRLACRFRTGSCFYECNQ
jgi:hypothetical protein